MSSLLRLRYHRSTALAVWWSSSPGAVSAFSVGGEEKWARHVSAVVVSELVVDAKVVTIDGSPVRGTGGRVSPGVTTSKTATNGMWSSSSTRSNGFDA